VKHVPGIDRARQSGSSRHHATFGLKEAVKRAVSSARNTNLSTNYATAALLGIFHNFPDAFSRRQEKAHALLGHLPVMPLAVRQLHRIADEQTQRQGTAARASA